MFQAMVGLTLYVTNSIRMWPHYCPWTYTPVTGLPSTLICMVMASSCCSQPPPHTHTHHHHHYHFTDQKNHKTMSGILTLSVNLARQGWFSRVNPQLPTFARRVKVVGIHMAVRERDWLGPHPVAEWIPLRMNNEGRFSRLYTDPSLPQNTVTLGDIPTELRK